MKHKTYNEKGEVLCSKCHVFMPNTVENFAYNNACSDGLSGVCRNCQGQYRKDYYEKHKVHVLDLSRIWHTAHKERHKIARDKYWRKLKTMVIEAYGGCCACCGEHRSEFLSIDHVNNDGAKERRMHSRGNFYLRLKQQGFPKDKYQLLCMNCNFAKGQFGICPHEKEKGGK